MPCEDVGQRLPNYIDDNTLIIQLLASLEAGHGVDTAAKAHSFVNLAVLPRLTNLGLQEAALSAGRNFGHITLKGPNFFLSGRILWPLWP
jgi:hypothetical protein